MSDMCVQLVETSFVGIVTGSVVGACVQASKVVAWCVALVTKEKNHQKLESYYLHKTKCAELQFNWSKVGPGDVCPGLLSNLLRGVDGGESQGQFLTETIDDTCLVSSRAPDLGQVLPHAVAPFVLIDVSSLEGEENTSELVESGDALFFECFGSGRSDAGNVNEGRIPRSLQEGNLLVFTDLRFGAVERHFEGGCGWMREIKK